MSVFPAETAVRAATVLREYIAAGRLRPGTKLAEQELADSLEVSRNTLRVAFTELQGEGLVVRIPNRGCFVARPDAGDVQEIYRVRRLVEPAAVMWCRPTPEALQKMQDIVEESQAALEQGDGPAMADANDALHRAIVSLSGSATLEETMDRVLARTRLVFLDQASTPDFHGHYVGSNARLVQRLANGERELAAEELREYMDVAERELLSRLDSGNEKA